MLIPKVIHRIWIGPNQRPEVFSFYGNSWQWYHPTWRMVTWTNEDVETLFPLVNQDLYDEEIRWSGRSNLLRYEILLRYGGVYVDCDYECLKNIEPVIEDWDCFAVCEDLTIWNGGPYLNNALMGCTPGNTIMQDVVDGVAKRNAEYPGTWSGMRTGPGHLSSFADRIHYPLQVNTFMGDYAVHHYAQSWRWDIKGNKL